MEDLHNDSGLDKKKLIVIVDDNHENLLYVSNILRKQGFEAITAQSGFEAVEIIRLRIPDLILMDVSMPEFDGIETCTLIRSSVSTSDIPVIFITASTDNDSINKCFDCGGSDYISKPVRREELLSRVYHQLELKSSREQINKQNLELKRLNSDKTEFMRIAVHDLKNPLYTSLGFLQYLQNKSDSLSTRESDDIINYAKTGIQECLQIIHDFLEISSIEDGRLRLQYDVFNLNDIILNAIRQNSLKAVEKRLVVEFDSPPGEITINTDVCKVQQILDNILSNAIKFSPYDKRIRISSRNDNHSAIIEIEDEGPGIKEEEKELLFTKFSKLSARPTGNESSTGLGLSIVRLLAERLNGRVWCQSQEGLGAKFIIELPLDKEILSPVK